MLKKGILSDRRLVSFFILASALFAYAGFCNAAYAVSTPAEGVAATTYPMPTMPPILGDKLTAGQLLAGTSPGNAAAPRLDTIEQGVLSNDEDRLVVDIRYPITGNQLIDLEIFTWANGQMQTFLSAVRGFKEDDGNATFDYLLNIDYKTFQTSKTFSVIFNTSTYTGGAHPGSGQISFVFKLDDASRLRFSDIFQTDEKSIATLLSSLCYARLKEDLGKLGFAIAEDALPAELDNFAAFVIDKTGLIIFFEPYQVAPYSFGYQAVSIPLKDLEPLKPRLELWQTR